MRPRPSAFDVSFPEESRRLTSSGSSTLSTSNSNAHSHPSPTPKSSKRQTPPEHAPNRMPKRRRLEPPTLKDGSTRYHCHCALSKSILQLESERTVFPSEEDSGAIDDGTLPVRILTDFCFYDNSDLRQPHYPLSWLDGADNATCDFIGVGDVRPCIQEEEDDDQEDDVDSGVPMRLSAILMWYIDYQSYYEPIWIQTQYAWYKLDGCSLRYEETFLEFYRPHRIAQLVICAATQDNVSSLEQFETKYLKHEQLRIRLKDVVQEFPTIKTALELLDDADPPCTPPVRQLMHRSPLVELFHNHSRYKPKLSGQSSKSLSRKPAPRVSGRAPGAAGPRQQNIDNLVLRPEFQQDLIVTPFVARLCHPDYSGPVTVLGSKKDSTAKRHIPTRSLNDIQRILDRANLQSPSVLDLHHSRRVFGRKPYLSSFGAQWPHEEIGVNFSVKDVVLVLKGKDADRPNQLPTKKSALKPNPENAKLSDYFWFAQIMYINPDAVVHTESGPPVRGAAHVRWFDHAQETFLGEFGDPRELFYSIRCDMVCLRQIVGKVTVSFAEPFEGDFFCRLQWNQRTGAIEDIQQFPSCTFVTKNHSPPNDDLCSGTPNGPWARATADNGVEYDGSTYHVGDFVLFATEWYERKQTAKMTHSTEPCGIGQITAIIGQNEWSTSGDVNLIVKVWGRVDDLRFKPAFWDSHIRDTQHLFQTDDERGLTFQFVVGKAFVTHIDNADLAEWREWPHHFYGKFYCPTTTPSANTPFAEIEPSGIRVCATCYQEELDMQAFTRDSEPLPLFDPTAGVGALTKGLEMTGIVETTHACEISPSAAYTLKKNSPHTQVWNADANQALRAAVKADAGLPLPEDAKIGIDGKQLPVPPAPGRIKVIAAGFPCQPHSGLNRFRKASDVKSLLFLTVLSWVDFYKPDYCVFENVRGFVTFKLSTTQTKEHRVEGGVENGGLCQLVAILVAMGYQVRFALLQAGHYGAPQGRVRFFLMAAKTGRVLPEFPQPTHTAPLDKANDALSLRINGFTLTPIIAGNQFAPHRFTTVDDAISDLPSFDWKHPKVKKLPEDEQQKWRKRARTVVPKPVDPAEGYCGFDGNVALLPAQSTYQLAMREGGNGNSRVTGHFTRALNPKTVERTLSVSLKANANSSDIPISLRDWQLSHPLSAHARSGFKPTFYGRLDANAWTNTIVTNVEPTAKQGKVLHPWCHRTLTVRELARVQGFPDSFEFYSLDRDGTETIDVKQMHRQIGNAVPFQISLALGRELAKALFKDSRKV